MGARTIGAVVISVIAVGTVAVEAGSWAQSARIGPPTAMTLPCAIRFDTVTAADRRSGLQAGDVVNLSTATVAARVAQVFHYTATQAGRAGETLSLAVSRDGRQLPIRYTLQHTDPWTTFAAELLFKLIALGIGGFVLWRGSGNASFLLGMWCGSLAIGLPDAWWGALPLAGRVTGAVVTAFLWTTTPFILYLVVESLATGVSRAARIVTRLCMVALILPELIVNAVNTTAQVLSGCTLVSASPVVSNALFTASQFVIIAFFALSYARTSGLAKQRVRWVFWAFMLSRIGVVLNLANRLLPHPLQLSGLEWATVMIFPLGCTYAILRHRIIDVNFVLNRTLVLTILTTFIVGIFILLEDVLSAVAASHGTGLIVETIVALVIGFSFNAMHKRLEAAVARFIFRAKYEAANLLRRLAQEAPFMESADALLNRTAREVCAASGAAAAIIYERIGDTYRMTASAGEETPTQSLPVDDLAFVRMRSSRTPIDLAEVDSALGKDGIAFPLSIRGALSGALVCRRRPNGEAYAPDEIALLGGVAHEVGTEVNAIRSRVQSELLDALLGGKIDVGEARTMLRA
jgi:hypothetical protein